MKDDQHVGDYYRRRIEQERTLAAKATTAAIGSIHARLADEYERKVRADTRLTIMRTPD